MRKFLVITILLSLISCFTFSTRKQKTHKKDFTNLSEKEYAEKYYSLPFKSQIDLTELKRNQAYIYSKTYETFQIFVFADNGYIYSTNLLYMTNYQNIPSQRVFKIGVFTNSEKNIKTERIVSNPEGLFGFIEEGIIKNDTIFITNNYHADTPKKRTSESKNYVLAPNINVSKFGGNINIEFK